MTTQMTPEQPNGVMFDDLIERYRQDPRHGEQWVADRAWKIIAQVSQACEDKDYASLRAVCYPDNPFSRDVFTRITGIQLHRTQRESRRLLAEFVGSEIVAAYQEQQEREWRKRQSARLQRQLAFRQVRAENYGTLSVDEFIQRLIADGYTSIVEQKRGVAPEWFLRNQQGCGYTFRRRVEHDYIEMLLEQQKKEQPEENENCEDSTTCQTAQE